MPHGPDRSELKLRLGISLVGLALLGLAVLVRGFRGAGMIEVIGIAGLFFGASAVRAALRLKRQR